MYHFSQNKLLVNKPRFSIRPHMFRWLPRNDRNPLTAICRENWYTKLDFSTKQRLHNFSKIFLGIVFLGGYHRMTYLVSASKLPRKCMGIAVNVNDTWFKYVAEMKAALIEGWDNIDATVFHGLVNGHIVYSTLYKHII